MQNVIFKDDILNKEFTYSIYNDIDDSKLIEMFNNQKEELKRKLWKGNADNWLKSKVKLYGIAMSKPELFEFITPQGLNSPYSYYEIKLKQYATKKRKI